MPCVRFTGYLIGFAFVTLISSVPLTTTEGQNPDQQPKATFAALVIFRAPTALAEALAEHADQRGVSVSALSRELLVAALSKV
jgi:predicted HicB family RNase H-like nuclease